MTEAERQAYIDRIVSAAPALTPEDARRVRAWVPLRSRVAVEGATTPALQKRRRTAA